MWLEMGGRFSAKQAPANEWFIHAEAKRVCEAPGHAVEADHQSERSYLGLAEEALEEIASFDDGACFLADRGGIGEHRALAIAKANVLR